MDSGEGTNDVEEGVSCAQGHTLVGSEGRSVAHHVEGERYVLEEHGRGQM